MDDAKRPSSKSVQAQQVLSFMRLQRPEQMMCHGFGGALTGERNCDDRLLSRGIGHNRLSTGNAP